MSTLPGTWLTRFANATFSTPTRKQVFDPIIADLQHEYFDAIATDQPRTAQSILWQGRRAFAVSVLVYGAANWRHIIYPEHPVPSSKPLSQRPLSVMLSLGVLGAIIVVGSAMWVTIGPMLLLPWAIFMIGVGVVLRSIEVESYRDRFIVGLGAFMMTSFAFYLWVFFVLVPRTQHHLPPIPFFGHVWRAGFFLLIGVIVCVPLAVVSATPSRVGAR